MCDITLVSLSGQVREQKTGGRRDSRLVAKCPQGETFLWNPGEHRKTTELQEGTSPRPGRH